LFIYDGDKQNHNCFREHYRKHCSDRRIRIIQMAAGIPVVSGTVFAPNISSLSGLDISRLLLEDASYSASIAESGTAVDSETGDLQYFVSESESGSASESEDRTLAASASQSEVEYNWIRNNTGVGAVAGTPGTIPTDWAIAFGGATGISSSIVGTGTENNIPYIDIRIFGTSSTGVTTTTGIFAEFNQSVVSAASNSWTVSFYIKVTAGSMNNVNNGILIAGVHEYSGAGSFLRFTSAGSGQVTPTGNALNTQRFIGSFSVLNASTVALRPIIGVGIPTGVPIDITLRIGQWQLQTGTAATPAVSTSGTVQTLTYDSISTLASATESESGLAIDAESNSVLQFQEDDGNALDALDSSMSSTEAQIESGTATDEDDVQALMSVTGTESISATEAESLTESASPDITESGAANDLVTEGVAQAQEDDGSAIDNPFASATDLVSALESDSGTEASSSSLNAPTIQAEAVTVLDNSIVTGVIKPASQAESNFSSETSVSAIGTLALLDEPITADESLSGVTTESTSVVESTSASSAQDRLEAAFAAVLEAGSATDSKDRSLTLNDNQKDTANPIDLIDGAKTVYPSQSESIYGSEYSSTSMATVVSETEIGIGVDSSSGLTVRPGSAQESVSAADLAIQSDSINPMVVEDASSTVNSNRTSLQVAVTAEVGNLNDTSASSEQQPVVLTETGTASSPVSSVALISPSVTEEGSSADSISNTSLFATSLTENESALDTLVVNALRSAEIVEIGTPTDPNSVSLSVNVIDVEASVAADVGSSGYSILVSNVENAIASDLTASTIAMIVGALEAAAATSLQDSVIVSFADILNSVAATDSVDRIIAIDLVIQESLTGQDTLTVNMTVALSQSELVSATDRTYVRFKVTTNLSRMFAVF
jgi:hypothetical protein